MQYEPGRELISSPFESFESFILLSCDVTAFSGGSILNYSEGETPSERPPTHPSKKKKKHNLAQTAMFYYNNISVRQAYCAISQLHKSFNRTFEKHSAQNSISYQNLNKYTLYT